MYGSVQFFLLPIFVLFCLVSLSLIPRFSVPVLLWKQVGNSRSEGAYPVHLLVSVALPTPD